MPTYKSSTPKPLSASPRGFALVIALSLMSFVLLLVLSLSTLLQVENSTAATSAAQLEARMNAQLGAMIALGDLQRYTGPDQRVTARSDILLAPGERGPAGQERWTGVWSSKSNTSDALDTVDGLNNRQPVWLVSGENPDATAAIGTNTVALATVGKSVIDKSSNGTDDTVLVESEPILGSEDNESGRFAYWVSDEGIKARVNLADPHLDSFDPDAEYYRNAMAQVADPTAVSNYEGVQRLTATNSRWKNENLDPASITSLKNIPMFLEPDLGGANLDGVNREFFHDFTVHSSGVLANVKDGGLKRDLSTALLSLPTDLQGPMFPPADLQSVPGSMDPGGPKWEQLSDYYKLAKSNGKTASSTIELRLPTNDQVGFAPVVTRWNFMVQGFAERKPNAESAIENPNTPWVDTWCLNTDPSTPPGTDIADWKDGAWQRADGYRYSLGLFPLITLWNPYDQDMTFEDLGLEVELPKIIAVEADSPNDGYNQNAGTVVEFKNSDYQEDETRIKRHTVKFAIQGITLKAGEAVNFAPPTNAFYDVVPENNMLVPREGGPMANGFFTSPVEAQASNVEFYLGLSRGNKGIDRAADRNDDLEYEWNWNSPSRLHLSSDSNLWKQLVMLYSSPELDEENMRGPWDARFFNKERFKVLTFPGRGSFESGFNQSRIILTNRIEGMDDELLAFIKHINSGGSSNGNYKNPFLLFSSDGRNSINGTSYFADFVGEKGDSLLDPDDQEGLDSIIEISLLHHYLLGNWPPFGAYGKLKFPEVPFNTDLEIESHVFRHMNPTAPVIHKEPNVTDVNSNYDETPIYTRGSIDPWKYSTRDQYVQETLVEGTEEVDAYVGLSNTMNDGSRKLILYEVPQGVPLSLGQLAHANLMNHDVFIEGLKDPAIADVVEGNGLKWQSHTLQLYATPTHAIGNSLANPFLKLNETKRWEQIKRNNKNLMNAAHYDYSYELNNVLWDEFFFTGIKELDEVPSFPLPNSRLQLWESGSVNLALEKRAAAGLLLVGAFNVNSTSVAAWEGLLGAMRDIDTLGVNPAEAKLRHNFSRFTAPLLDTPGENPNLSSKDEIAAGFRNLSDAQIAALAREIVNQVRLRSATADADGQKYPFLSLSDFINRSTDTSTASFALCGPLQAAIDATGINGVSAEMAKDGLWNLAAKHPLYYEITTDTGVVERPLVEGMPGFLQQSDLLAKVGGALQARSDTFTIRSYGSSQDSLQGDQSSRAYYEIVVQRTPNYINTLDADHDDATLPVNENFGRRYNIISQIWVKPDEI